MDQAVAAERRKVTFFGAVFGNAANVAVWRHFGILGMMVAGLVGCASTHGTLSPSSSTEARNALAAERAGARWQALMKGDYPAAYEFMSEASRKIVSLDQFRARSLGRGVVWRDATVRGAKCDAEVCKVDLFVTYDHPKIKGMGFPVTETWVIERGSTWYVDPAI
jgi:hypothetical protein